MSVRSTDKRITAPEVRARKGAEPLVALTAYSALTAHLVDQHADVILVGDNLA
ncbi:3-methyl-2-oxobutanoate hydroxymethyltransferase (plasmid) [Agrobacterium tumefaciens F2]|jgi:3-methyl-2-oxobutanoate hydroxymethyltransferase|nr:3-methyl-2-oxobutanoate hydroxymethyltransferase [Agrobacterium tumefaciens F2]